MEEMKSDFNILSNGSEMNEEEGEGLGERDQDHPLLNDVVLEKLFEYVRRWDLLVYRGVCKKWNVLTIPFIRAEFTVRIHGSCTRNPDKETRKNDDFVAVFTKNTLGIPFAKFKIDPFCTTEGIGQEFLKLCGDTTKEIHLCQDEQGNESFKVEDVSELLRSMKKLEKLTLSDKLVTNSGNVEELFPDLKPKLSSLKIFTLEPVEPEDLEKSCPTFLEELLTAAPNISDLTIGDFRRTTGEADHQNIRFHGFKVLTFIEKLGRESSIRKLSLDGVRMRSHVELIRIMTAKPNGLKLKELSFDMEEELDTHEFHLIKLFMNTLEDLEMISLCSSFINFPKMPKLTRLDFKVSKDFDSTLINFKKIFPVLKELLLYQEVGEDGFQVYDEFLAHSEPCPTIKSFKILFGLYLRMNPFNHVLTIFPRLTELRIWIKVDGAEIVRQIWTQMTQLESLSIFGKLQTMESMDSLFTGISTETIRGISDVVNDLEEMTVEHRRDTILNLRNQHSHLPSINNLTNLRGLQLNVKRDRTEGRWNRLSDVTGFLGFYSLKHLSRLEVLKCKLTKTCCEILTTEMEVGLETWTFQTTSLESIIPPRTY